MTQSASRHHALAQPAVAHLKRKSVVGGVAVLAAQGVRFVLQTATMMVLARVLSPNDFGLQGMVAVVTGFLALFGDAGLGIATVQRLELTHEQASTLFWINVAVGAMLAMLCAALAPLLVGFYQEPRLYWIAVVSGTTFLFNGLTVQHGALLQRAMRFVTLAKINVLSLAASSATGVVMALLGCRYWSLVGMMMASSIVGAAAVWLAVPWIPGPPRRRSGIRSMLHFGGLAICNGFVVFLAWNAEKLLLGRFCGADALGLYGRAYQLVTLPVQQLNGAITGVAFPALSRIQLDAERLASSFLRGYSLLISLTIPISIISALFAEEIVRIVLGAKWMEAAPIFRLLAPVALVFAVANPLSWLVISTGRIGRALSISMAVTPLVIVGIVLGLARGPQGVALGYSTALMVLLIPIAAWSKHGTGITWADLWGATKPPFLSGLLAGAAGLLVKLALDGSSAPLLCLTVGLAAVFGIYAWALLIVMGQKHIYIDVLSQLLPWLQQSHQVSHPILAKTVSLKVLGKSAADFYLRLNRWIWQHLSLRVRNSPPVRCHGAWVHALVCLRASRRQYLGTSFLRNRPALELMRCLAQQKAYGSTLRIAVLACSIGAEVYSILWTIRSARPDLKVVLCAVDISKKILSFAEKGIYDPDSSELVGAQIFERLAAHETREMFDWKGDQAKVKSWLREGIAWRLGDAADPELILALGPHDMVVANNFLCHMAPADAAKCLRNIGQLAAPGGYLFVSGVDLDVRTKVALDLGWEPLAELIAEIHEGDPSVRADWPWQWWGLEPLNRRRHDWQTRYAAAFRIAGP
jgi:O-antigen/teichoic acid export membrane protein/SAM-dependent methyltransferase